MTSPLGHHIIDTLQQAFYMKLFKQNKDAFGYMCEIKIVVGISIQNLSAQTSSNLIKNIVTL